MTTLIYGPPCGGKTELVQKLRIRGDLVLDFDQVHSALSGLDLHDHHDAITPFVLDAIQAITDGRLSHNGDAALVRHFSNAILREDHRGSRITKTNKSSTRKIDAAVA